MTARFIDIDLKINSQVFSLVIGISQSIGWMMSGYFQYVIRFSQSTNLMMRSAKDYHTQKYNLGKE